MNTYMIFLNGTYRGTIAAASRDDAIDLWAVRFNAGSDLGLTALPAEDL
jgi:hypothetical protein